MALRRRFLEHLVRGGSIARYPEPGSYQTPEQPPTGGVLTVHLLVAIAMMVCLHGFWLIWLSPESAEPVSPRAPAAHLVVLSPKDHPWRESPQGWSPVLFPLPTPVGFSDFAVLEDTGVGPALTAPPSSVPFLERETYSAPPPPRSEADPGLGQTIAHQMERERRAPVVESVLASIPWPRYQGLRLHVSDGLAREDLAAVEIPGAPLLDRHASWEATAWLEFDAFGRVEHAFIETSSGDRERDRDLLRSLYQWQMRPESASRRGRAHFLYFHRIESDLETMAPAS